MKKYIPEFIVVIIAIAIATTFHAKPEIFGSKMQGKSSLSTAQNTPVLEIGEKVPPFGLINTEGKRVVFNEETGPLMIILTATGCQGCIQRIDKDDVSAYEMAQKAQFKVWNQLVYLSPERSEDFAKKYQPSADEVMADPQAKISVKTLGGSDSTCWLLIDAEGHLAYRGPADLSKLEMAFNDLAE